MGWHDVSEKEILQANIEKYDNEHIVNFYKDFKEPKYAYVEYEIIFGAILQMLSEKLGDHLRAVDICGGAGKAAFIMKNLAPQADVILVDLSEKMLNIARQRNLEENTRKIEILQEDAFTFLDRDCQFDIIVFSSAIHHFKDPVNLLKSAAGCLSEHGVIITIADPNTLSKTRRFKTMAFLICNWGDKKIVMKKIVRRIMGLGSSEVAASNDEFDMAEYQAYTGINNLKLEHDLNNSGLHTLLHIQYPAGGPPFMMRFMSFFRLHWSFSFILTKKRWDDQEQVAEGLRKRIGQGLPFKCDYL